jgi:hypothetical protein
MYIEIQDRKTALPRSCTRAKYREDEETKTTNTRQIGRSDVKIHKDQYTIPVWLEELLAIAPWKLQSQITTLHMQNGNRYRGR